MQSSTPNPETREPILECRDLRVSISGQRVVDQLDLAVGPGQSIGILGPNGVGKTTLLLALAGVMIGLFPGPVLELLAAAAPGGVR